MVCIGKLKATFLGHVMRRENLEHFMTIGMMKGKCCSGKQRGKMLDRVTKWLNVGRVIDALKVTRDRD